jgi:hypothetical protein
MTGKTIAPMTTTSTSARNVSLEALLRGDTTLPLALLLGQEGHNAPHITHPFLDWNARKAALLQTLDEVEMLLDT